MQSNSFSVTADLLKQELQDARAQLAAELDKREKLIRHSADLKMKASHAIASSYARAMECSGAIVEEWQPLLRDDNLFGSSSSHPPNENASVAGDLDYFCKALLTRAICLLRRVCPASSETDLRYDLSLLVDTQQKSKIPKDPQRSSKSVSSDDQFSFVVYRSTQGAAGSTATVIIDTTGEIFAVSSSQQHRTASSMPGAAISSDSRAAVEQSALERCLRSKQSVEEPSATQSNDFIGLTKPQLDMLLSSDTGNNRSESVNSLRSNPVNVLLVPIAESSGKLKMILRLLFTESKTLALPTGDTSKTKSSSTVSTNTNAKAAAANGNAELIKSVFRNALQSAGTVGLMYLRLHYLRNHSSIVVEQANARENESRLAVESANNKMNRVLRMHKIVCREASALLDAPVVSSASSGSHAVHPAALSPLVASQDVSLKVLTMIRSLLRTEGQALLLKDVTSTPSCYQVIV